MRHNDARKWLHAGLDLLPLILIPVFMIYSHRHTIDSGSIDVPVNKVVDFNQHAGNFVNREIVLSDVDVKIEDSNFIILDGTSSSSPADTLIQLYNADIGHQYVISGCFVQVYDSSLSWVANVNQPVSTSWDTRVLYNFTTGSSLALQVFIVENTTYNHSIFYPQIFDLTQMFGVGNEPTLQQFNNWYPNDYYDYTLSHKELLKGYSTQTYNDTDIMSQFTYQLYNSVDKYFNMGNVFNLGGVYDWFNLNIFNGNAPIAVYIVWQVVLYEFVMDLLFLLYGLFMWFIDMCKHLMEKPFRSIK